MNTSDGRRLLFTFGIPAAIIIAVAGVTLLLGNDIARRASAIQDTERELASRAQAVESLALLRAESERATRYSSVLGNILPTKDQLINLPQEFDLIAKKYGVRLAATFGAETPATDAAPGSIDIVFTAVGTLPHILEFVQDAETSRYILEWTSFEFLRTPDGYSATMAGRVFSR